MFEQFWQRYPQGNLISEFVAVNNGKYIVRALVQIDGITRATGLSTADTVEEAEDKAKERAIAALNSLYSSPSRPSKPAEAEKTRKVVSPPFADVSASPETELMSSRIGDNGIVSSSTSVGPELNLTNLPEPSGFENEVSMPLDTPVSLSPESETSSPPDFVNESIQGETMIDFSDVIARTNVELRRLGWTSEQGRVYLTQTYGKRSRQLLTDSELLEFLQYLESLPTA